jgi:hypothetical protein
LVFILQTQRFYTEVACGPTTLVGSEIPEWFNDKSTNLFGTVQMHTYLGSNEWKGYALFIVYQFCEPDTYPRKKRKQKVPEHGNSNSRIFEGGNPHFPYFVCQFQANKVDLGKPLVLCARGVPSVGPSGFWVYIPAKWFRRRGRNSLDRWSNLEASISTGRLNVEVKECGARVVRHHDASKLYQVLNNISPRGLDLESYKNLFTPLDDMAVQGPIQGNLL